MQIQKISSQQAYKQNNNKQNPSFGMYFGIKPEVVTKFSNNLQEFDKLELRPQEYPIAYLKKTANIFITRLLRDMIEHNETAANHKVYDSIHDIASIDIANQGNNINPRYKLTTKHGDEFEFTQYSLEESDNGSQNIMERFQNKLIAAKTSTEEARQADNQ